METASEPPICTLRNASASQPVLASPGGGNAWVRRWTRPAWLTQVPSVSVAAAMGRTTSAYSVVGV